VSSTRRHMGCDCIHGLTEALVEAGRRFSWACWVPCDNFGPPKKANLRTRRCSRIFPGPASGRRYISRLTAEQPRRSARNGRRVLNGILWRRIGGGGGGSAGTT